MKKILPIFLILMISFYAFGMSVTQYIQIHKMRDGGYADTPTVVSRYGNPVETIYLKKLSDEYGEKTIPLSYLENYLNLLKDHPSYFKVVDWMNYSIAISKYLKSKGVSVDLKFLNALDVFLNKHLKNYMNSSSFYQVVIDDLTLTKMLGKDPSKFPAYKYALEAMKKSVNGKLYANVGLAIMTKFEENGMTVPKMKNIKKFVSNSMGYISDDYVSALSLLKLNLLDKENVEKILDAPEIDLPSQLYAYMNLCKIVGRNFQDGKAIFEKMKAERAPFGGFYVVGESSSISNSYWATKALNIFGVKFDKNYWKNLTASLIETSSSYPPNMLAEYMYYILDINSEYHFMKSSQIDSLSKTFASKMDLTPSLEAYYLAKLDFEKASELLYVIQKTNFRNDKMFLDIHTVLDRLFKGLNNVKEIKRNLGYYYDYVQLLNFAYEFGYKVDKKTVENVENKFLYHIKSSSYVDLNLLNASLSIERKYILPIDKKFYLSKIAKLKDPKSGGYFYNTIDGLLMFKSIYIANTMLTTLNGGKI